MCRVGAAGAARCGTTALRLVAVVRLLVPIERLDWRLVGLIRAAAAASGALAFVGTPASIRFPAGFSGFTGRLAARVRITLRPRAA